MTPPFGFGPDQARALRMDARMRKRLAESLAYIGSVAEHRVPFRRDTFDGLLHRISRAPVSPLVFGVYCDLVLAITAGRLDEAAGLLDEIVAASDEAPTGLIVRALGDPAHDPDAARVQRLVDTDRDRPVVLCPPPPEMVDEAHRRIGAAFALLDAGFPALADELRTLIREIVLTVNDPDAPSRFDGASSFMLWGAMVLSAEIGARPIALVEGLAHESGHSVLFGLCADGPLVENDDVDRFASPLRSDPRPMDGIVHAAFVVARMHQAVRTILEAGVLGDDDAEYARASLDQHARAFQRGIDTIDRHARLTPLGRQIMAGARDYMAA